MDKDSNIRQDNIIAFNHGRGNNWAMSYTVERPAKDLLHKARGFTNIQDKVDATKKPTKTMRPEFDTLVNIKHFDLYEENRAMIEAVRDRVA